MSIFDTDRVKHICGVLRSAKYEYNKAFLESGSIKFGIPKKWVDIGKERGEGRGDVAEGMFVTFDKFDCNRAFIFGKKYSIPNDDIIVESFNNRVFYRRKSTMNLPTFCLYGIKYDLFDIKPQKGNQTVSGRIPRKYFRAFSSIEEINNKNISEKEKLSVVYISNYNLLKERIISKLKKMGISEEEIIAEPINYYDTEVYGDNYWYEISSDKPKELLWKRKEFENQSEIRIYCQLKK